MSIPFAEVGGKRKSNLERILAHKQWEKNAISPIKMKKIYHKQTKKKGVHPYGCDKNTVSVKAFIRAGPTSGFDMQTNSEEWVGVAL